MKKEFKYFLAIMLSVIMLFSFPLSASAFARKDVTKTYQKSVAKMMRNFDYYMAWDALGIISLNLMIMPKQQW